jgi:Domain of unknown function (DUF4115)
MSILLLVVVLLVIAIVLSRLTWASQLGERRSIKHHEQAMDVLRSVAGRPEDAEAEANGAQSAYSAAHVSASVEDGAGFPAPAGGSAVPEASVRREETIRILRAEASGAEVSTAEPSRLAPSEARPEAPWEPAASPAASTTPAPSLPAPPEELPGSEATGATGDPAGVDARPAGVGSPPSWEPAHAPQATPDGDGQPAQPAIVFLADDTGRPGPVTMPPPVADAVRRSDRGHWANGARWGDGHRRSDGGWADGRRSSDGRGWGNGHRWEDDPAAGSSVLPKPPAIGDQDWSASSRSEARSRSRARTRSRLLGRVLAPFVATGRAASGARDRLGARRVEAPVHEADAGSHTWSSAPVGAGVTAEGVRVVTDETTEVTRPTAAEVTATSDVVDADVTTAHTGEGAAVDTAPVAEVPAASSPLADHASVPEGFGAAALDARRAGTRWGPKVSRLPRSGLVVGLAAIVVVVCVVAGVLVATMSTSSNKGQPSRQAAPPASSAPAPPPSPVSLVSHDDQGAVYNVRASQLSLSAVASGRVWMEIVSGTGPFGPVLWQGILNPGQTQTITNSAPVWVRIGAASNVAVTVNGGGVLLPQSPTTYNLTFSHA